MNNYNANAHHRRSIRLKGYDYSKEGLYFITICLKNRESIFGEIVEVDYVRAENMKDDIVRHNNFQPRKEMILNRCRENCR